MDTGKRETRYQLVKVHQIVRQPHSSFSLLNVKCIFDLLKSKEMFLFVSFLFKFPKGNSKILLNYSYIFMFLSICKKNKIKEYIKSSWITI